MIIVIIICGILYLFMIYGVIYLYYTYRKDIEELENRFLVLEKRTKDIDILQIENYIERSVKTELIQEKFKDKEGDTMACKKGRGGKKK